MENVLSLEVTIPIMQIATLLALCTTIILWGRFRIALVVSFMFLYYWGYIAVDAPEFVRAFDDIDFIPAAGYYGFGFIIFILCVIGLLKHDD